MITGCILNKLYKSATQECLIVVQTPWYQKLLLINRAQYVCDHLGLHPVVFCIDVYMPLVF